MIIYNAGCAPVSRGRTLNLESDDQGIGGEKMSGKIHIIRIILKTLTEWLKRPSFLSFQVIRPLIE